MAPRRKPHRPLTKSLTLVSVEFDMSRECWYILAKDVYQYYRVEVDSGAFDECLDRLVRG